MDMMLYKSMQLARYGMKAEADRMRTITENVANSNSTAPVEGADPYRRKVPRFASMYKEELAANVVIMNKYRHDKSPFKTRYEPGHPMADDKGFIKLPNVNVLIELHDYRQAQRSYEANMSIITLSKDMMNSTIDIFVR